MISSISNLIASSMLLCIGVTSPVNQTQEWGWKVKLLPTGSSYKLHQWVSEGSFPLTDWSTTVSNWVWGNSNFSTSLFDGLNSEDSIFGVYDLGITHQGGVKAAFQWEGGTQNKPAPTHLYVRVTTGADAWFPNLHGDGAVNNGLSYPVASFLGHLWMRGDSVVKLSVANDGSATTGTTMLYSSSQSTSSFGFPSGSVDYKAEVLSPVIITSVIEASHKKGAGDIPVTCLRNADGALEVHAYVVWDESVQKWVAVVELEGSGGYETITAYDEYAWNIEGAGRLLVRSSSLGNQFMVLYIDDLPLTDDLQLNKMTLLSVEQRNGEGGVDRYAPMTNSYKINWHYPYENWSYASSPEESYNIDVPISQSPSRAHYGDVVDVVYWKPPVAWGLTKLFLDWSPQLLRHPIYKGFCKYASIAVEELTPEEKTATTTFDHCWDNTTWSRWTWPDGIGHPFPPETPGPQEWVMTHAPVVHGFRTREYKGDEYNSKGFVGITGRTVKKHFSQDYCGWFEIEDIGGELGNPLRP